MSGRRLGRSLAFGGARRLAAGGSRSPLARAAGAALRAGALAPLARRLAASPTAEHRQVAAMLCAAIEAGDHAAALALISTAGRRPDLGAEKIVSRRYRFVWIGNPKVASRSLIAALRSAAADAELIRGRSLDEVLEERPEARDYVRFAFVRHPAWRAYSFYADKHALALTDRDACRWFIEPYYGLSTGMSFGALCRWLMTPCGSDLFADRHWLSQSRQLRGADGRLPDFLGRYERLDADWRIITERLRLPFRTLPRLNVRPDARPGCAGSARPVDDAALALLRGRYADDFELGGYRHEHRAAFREPRSARSPR